MQVFTVIHKVSSRRQANFLLIRDGKSASLAEVWTHWACWARNGRFPVTWAIIMVSPVISFIGGIVCKWIPISIVSIWIRRRPFPNCISNSITISFGTIENFSSGFGQIFVIQFGNQGIPFRHYTRWEDALWVDSRVEEFKHHIDVNRMDN